MEALTAQPSAVSTVETIEVKLWEIYLLYHPAQLYKSLSEHSVDNGPAASDPEIGRVVFRFSLDNWENFVKPLLYRYRIPVVLQSKPVLNVATRGRQAISR